MKYIAQSKGDMEFFLVALYNNVTLLSISKVLVNVEGVACGCGGGGRT